MRRKPERRLSEHFSVPMTMEMLEQLRKESDRTQVPMTTLVRNAIAQWLAALTTEKAA